MRRRFDLIVFDFDGTLADSQSLLVGLVNEVLAAHGLPRAPDRAVAACIGLPLATVFRRNLRDAEDAQVAALCRVYRTHADAPAFVRQFRLFPGVRPTLANLRAGGARLAIGTSKGHATTRDILRHCRIDDVIEAVVGGDTVGRGKPHPETVERLLTEFGVSRARTLMVGDTTFDIEMGQAAGVSTCAVTYGMQPETSLRRLQPSFVIDRIDELETIVAGDLRPKSNKSTAGSDLEN
jgi:phosphoglycolate phosphatase